jgi:hypothetical protein
MILPPATEPPLDELLLEELPLEELPLEEVLLELPLELLLLLELEDPPPPPPQASRMKETVAMNTAEVLCIVISHAEVTAAPALRHTPPDCHNPTYRMG